MKPPNKYKAKFEKLEKDLIAKERLIYEEIREKYLIPFCNQNKIRYVTGMGVWFFIGKNGLYLSPSNYEYIEYDNDDNEIGKIKIPEELLDILYLEPVRHQNLNVAHMLSDYTPADYDGSLENPKKSFGY